MDYRYCQWDPSALGEGKAYERLRDVFQHLLLASGGDVEMALRTETKQQMKHEIVAHIARALRIEVSIGQQGATRIVLEARCRAGGLHNACCDSLRGFEEEIEAVVEVGKGKERGSRAAAAAWRRIRVARKEGTNDGRIVFCFAPLDGLVRSGVRG